MERFRCAAVQDQDSEALLVWNSCRGKPDVAGAVDDERRWARTCLEHGLFPPDCVFLACTSVVIAIE